MTGTAPLILNVESSMNLRQIPRFWQISQPHGTLVLNKFCFTPNVRPRTTRLENMKSFWSLAAGSHSMHRLVSSALAGVVLLVGPLAQAQEYRAVPELRIPVTNPNHPAAIGSVSSVVRLSNGSIVIADNTNLQVHFFTAGGRYVRSAGRDGQAPGEFRAVRWIGECARDSVFAFDYLKNRVSVFGVDGKLARTFSTPNAQTVIMRCSVDGTMAYVTAADFVGLTSRGSVQTYSATGKLLFRSAELLLDEGRPLGKSIKLSIANNTLIFGIGDSTMVTMMTSVGTLPKKIPVGMVGRVPTDVNRTAAMDYWATYLKGSDVDFEQTRKFLNSLPPVKALPAYSDMFLDDVANGAWVQTSVLGDPATVLEHISPEGAPQGKVSLPPNLMVQQVRDNVLIAKMTNAITGDESVVTYRLVAPRR